MLGEGQGFAAAAGDGVEITTVGENNRRAIGRDRGIAEPLWVVGLKDAEGDEPEEELFHRANRRENVPD